MRVLMVTSSYPKFPGDVTAPFIEEIARGVAARGHAVDVVLPYHPALRRSADEPVRFHPYHYAPAESLNIWGYAQSLEADVKVRREVYLLAPLVALSLRATLSDLLASRHHDVLHVHWVVPNAAFVHDLARAHRVPLVVSLHGSDVFMAERFAPAGFLARRAFAQAGATTACSGDLRRRALALGARAETTRTVPYGVDVAAFAPERADPGLRERLGLAPGELFVLALGRLVEKKGFRFLVEAAARTPGVRLVIAGQGDLQAELRGLAARLGVALLLPGALEREAMAAALASADVVAVPSVVDRAGNVDGLPNTLLEALASGRALVASRVAGIPDVVEDGRNGLLVPPADVAELARALARLRDEPELRRTLGAAARTSAVEQLTWPVAARAFEECYVQAAALGPR